MATVMMQYSLLDRRPEEFCFPLLEREGIGVLVRGALAQGLLAGKEPKAYLEFTAAQVEKLAAAAAGSGPSSALQFVWQQSPVCSAVVGIRTREQLREALEAISAEPIPENELERLRSVVRPLRYNEHRQP